MPWVISSFDPLEGEEVEDVDIVKPDVGHILSTDDEELVSRQTGEVRVSRSRGQVGRCGTGGRRSGEPFGGSEIE